MPKITYLFGAGASMNAMPLAVDMSKSMLMIADKVQEISTSVSSEYHTLLNFFCDELRTFAKEAANHRTVDTFAKKLFVSGREEDFRKLKCLLSTYLNLIQMWVSFCDKRYDSLWASLIQKEYNNLPNNIRFLTWNYDLQMELSYEEYLPKSVRNIWTAAHCLNIVTNNFQRNELMNKGRFAIYKLNGNSNVYNNYAPEGLKRFKEEYLFDAFRNGWTNENVLAIIKGYSFLMNAKVRPTLSFAWEHVFDSTPLETSFIRVIEEDISDTDIVVIIGYSFPYFNREVDRALFKCMSNVKKIYIQDPFPGNISTSLNSVISDFSGKVRRGQIHIEEISDVDNQFFLPHEL